MYGLLVMLNGAVQAKSYTGHENNNNEKHHCHNHHHFCQPRRYNRTSWKTVRRGSGRGMKPPACRATLARAKWNERTNSAPQKCGMSGRKRAIAKKNCSTKWVIRCDEHNNGLHPHKQTNTHTHTHTRERRARGNANAKAYSNRFLFVVHIIFLVCKRFEGLPLFYFCRLAVFVRCLFVLLPLFFSQSYFSITDVLCCVHYPSCQVAWIIFFSCTLYRVFSFSLLSSFIVAILIRM